MNDQSNPSTVPAFPSGVIGAALTPLDAQYVVDHDRFEQLIDVMVQHCDAVSVLGAEVSEYSVLTPADRRDALRVAIAAVDSRVPVLAGVSSPSVAEVVELTGIAQDAGAEFIQVLIPLNPGGTAASAGDLVRYFEAIGAETSLPVVAYHNPPRGSDPSIDTIVRICEIDGVVAFKDSSRDLSRLGQLVEQMDLAGHAKYFGTMQVLLPTLMLGGSGAMMPPPGSLMGRQIVDAYLKGDIAEATKWQRAFTTFPASWSRFGLTATMKSAMRAVGLDLGEPAAPFAGLDESEYERMAQVLADVGARELWAGLLPVG